MSDEKPGEEAQAPPEQGQAGPGTDVGQVDADGLETRPFPESLPSEYRVTISEAAFEAIKEHANSDTA